MLSQDEQLERARILAWSSSAPCLVSALCPAYGVIRIGSWEHFGVPGIRHHDHVSFLSTGVNDSLRQFGLGLGLSSRHFEQVPLLLIDFLHGLGVVEVSSWTWERVVLLRVGDDDVVDVRVLLDLV